jgi:asparagine synthase (glutamine-hydrolysing)
VIFGKLDWHHSSPHGSGLSEGIRPVRWHFSSNDQGLFLGLSSSGSPSHDAAHVHFFDAQSGIRAALYGHLFNFPELAALTGVTTNGFSLEERGRMLVQGYLKLGTGFFKHLNGSFVLVIQDPARSEVLVARDHLGIESLHYYQNAASLYFSSDLQFLAQHIPGGADLNPAAVLRTFLMNYNPGAETLYKGVQKLGAGSCLRIKHGNLHIETYWKPSFQEPFSKSLEDYKAELPALFKEAVAIRMKDSEFRPGAFLSGGMDSSTVVHMMRSVETGPIHTFSFRCRGESYDESHYARLMSQRYGTVHHEIPYESRDTVLILEIAKNAPEPFSDIGIEVASYLLAGKAAEQSNYVLTGDGGDELFAGHPVYLADRAVQKLDLVWGLLKTCVFPFCRLLPDTEQKTNFLVKAKRFAYSAAFPATLYANRWRIYYQDAQFKALLQPDWYAHWKKEDPLQDIEDLYREADGQDFLSRALYGDYYTVVDFYLRRMEMLRQLGIEGRLPMLDPKLVDYAARIPSHFKLDKRGSTKWIFHQVMAHTLPDEIVFRKDKLGHSVPLKNWLRQSPQVQSLMTEILTSKEFRDRRIFKAKAVDRLMREHASKADNHSHRLWSLLVFELWCRAHLNKINQVSITASATLSPSA